LSLSVEFLNYVLEQLSALPRVTSRRMFGAVGLYCEGVFFGLIASDALYFKVGDSNRAEYESRSMTQFRPYADKPQVSMNYYEVPAEVLEDRDQCAMWARRSLAVARVKTKPGKTGTSPRRSRQIRSGRTQ
jgi:DNA transformation protein